MKKLILSLSTILLIVTLSSWGFLVHKTTHQLAVYALPKKLGTFFYQNLDYLVYNSVRPDVRRKDDKTEESKHFIDIDAPVFGENAIETMPEKWEDALQKYPLDTLLKYGTVNWEVMKLQKKLTNAFRNKMKDSILYYAADLGHYIEDAHVPLHTSINYDGQLSNQKGIHALWESVVPEIHITGYNLYQKHKARYLKDPQHSIWIAFRKSNSLLKDVLAEEIKASEGFTDATKFKQTESFGRLRKNYTGAFAKAYAARLGNTINERLLESASLVSDFWYTAWVDAGCPDLSEIQAVSPEVESKLKEEKKSWKANELISKGLLQSTKNKKAEE